MIKTENLEKLYESVIGGGVELPTKQLNECGFNSKDLNDLIQDGKIVRIKRGLYTLKSVDELFHYGKKLISQNEHEKATLCFERCFQIDPTHSGVCFQLFLRSIQNEDYQRAFELYEKLSQSENQFYATDFNFYLYLLSIITLVPEKYREYARCLKLEDIKVSFLDKRYKDYQLQNKIRIAALQRKLSFALGQLNDLIKNHGNMTVQDFVSKILLKKAVSVELKSKTAIVDFIKAKDYKNVVEHLLNKQERHNLSRTEEYILKLANKYLEISESKKIPAKNIFRPTNLFDAIDTENYNVALRISNEYIEKYHLSNDTIPINLLLNDICLLIESLAKPVIADTTDSLKEDNQVTTSSNDIVSFSVVLTSLIKGDSDDALIKLRSYLKSIEKLDFEFLIVDLIKISLLEKDGLFTKPMMALSLFSEENFQFDISNYIQDFYRALACNKFEAARLYLDIISNLNKLGQECTIIDELYQTLEISLKGLTAVKNDFSQQVVASPSPVEVIEDVKAKPLQVQKETRKKPKVEISQEKRDSEKEFLRKKQEELMTKKGIIILRTMDSERIDRIFDMLKDFPNMAATVIGDDNSQQVVLRYVTVVEERNDTKSIINLGNQAYYSGNYNECIEYYSLLLQTLNNPKAFIYGKLGISYMKIWNISKAIDYLTVATALAKKEGMNLDYSDLILRLKGEVSQEDAKPRFKMNLKEFNYSDVNDFYGILNFNEINDYIKEQGIDVESACQAFGLTSEECDIVKLIYAREFYIQGEFAKGDSFLKSYERSESKTEFTIKLFAEIQKNKRFYQHRPVENLISLPLKLVPKKK